MYQDTLYKYCVDRTNIYVGISKSDAVTRMYNYFRCDKKDCADSYDEWRRDYMKGKFTDKKEYEPDDYITCQISVRKSEYERIKHYYYTEREDKQIRTIGRFIGTVVTKYLSEKEI